MSETNEITNANHPMFRPGNKLAEVRERHRRRSQILSDTNIIDTSPISPMIRSMVPNRRPFIPPMVRQMGETTLQTRARRRGNSNLWANTPVQSNLPASELADIDITDELTEWDSVGFEWNRTSNKLIAYLTKGHKTYTVKIPATRLLKIFNMCATENGCAREHLVKKPTINGIFGKIGKWFKKAGKSIVKGVKDSVTAPFRFVKNPKKFIRDTGRSIKKTIKGVGKVALKVASSPIFAGVMTAIAAVPPLTAIGGAGLAAYAAANAIKPAFKAAEAAIDTVDAIAKKKKAGDIIGAMTSGISAMPGPAKGLMNAALKSVPDDTRGIVRAGAKVAKQASSKNVFKLKNGKLNIKSGDIAKAISSGKFGFINNFLKSQGR